MPALSYTYVIWHNVAKLKEFRFSQQCHYRFKSSDMWLRVDLLVGTAVSVSAYSGVSSAWIIFRNVGDHLPVDTAYFRRLRSLRTIEAMEPVARKEGGHKPVFLCKTYAKRSHSLLMHPVLRWDTTAPPCNGQISTEQPTSAASTEARRHLVDIFISWTNHF